MQPYWDRDTRNTACHVREIGFVLTYLLTVLTFMCTNAFVFLHLFQDYQQTIFFRKKVFSLVKQN